MIASSPKKRLLTFARFLPVAAVSLWALPASAENLITNGTFDADTAGWWGNAAMSTTDPADYMIEPPADGRLCVTMTASGKNPWDVILGYSNLALSAGKYYRIAFSATADVARTVKFKTGMGEAPYSDYFLQTIDVSPTATDFDVTYLNLHEDPAGQFQFQIGTPSKGVSAAGQFCIDNVVIEQVPDPAPIAYTTPSATGKPFKDYATMLKMGTAVDTPIFLSSPQHNAIVAGEFSAITPANSMKMNVIQPTQGVWDFVDTDGLYSWAQAHGLEFRGHPLVWHTQAPSWLTDPKEDGTVYTRDEMIAFMYAHIDALMGHFTPKLPYWDVVNEAIEADAYTGVFTYRNTFWHERIGDDFIELAFAHARAADPAAKLFYNDYNVEQMDAKSNRVFELVSALKAKGILDGVGLQSHYFAPGGIPDMAQIKANIERYNQIGVEVHITESDFRIEQPFSDENKAAQTKFYSDLLQVCIDAPNCTHFTVWGVSDVDSWVPGTFPNMGYAHLWDANLMPKASYQGMASVFAKYNPDGTPVSNGTGGGGGTGSGTAGGNDNPNAAASSNSSGCTIAPPGAPTKTSAALALLGLFGVSLLSRRASKRRA
jgi:endo-1,4-beta-xylanase